MMPRYLFVYGTLLRDQAPPEMSQLVQQLKRVGSARIAGRLFDLGEYPGATEPNRPRGSSVFGEVYVLPESEEVLDKLDEYEEFDRSQPAKSLFVRRRRMATLRNGRRVACWVYFYNRKVAPSREIEHGSYARLTKRRA